MEMLINIPGEIARLKTISQADIVLALAIQLYIDEEISLAKAAEIVGITRFAFQQLLVIKNIPFRYNTDDLSRELENMQNF
jgi:predicted HTH domain antitoxin